MSRQPAQTMRMKKCDPNKEWLNRELPEKPELQAAVSLFFNALNQPTAWEISSTTITFKGVDLEAMGPMSRRIIRATREEEDIRFSVKTICILFPAVIKSYVEKTCPGNTQSALNAWLARQHAWFTNRLELLWNFALSFPAEIHFIRNHFTSFCCDERITEVKAVLDEDDLLTPDSASNIANNLLELASRNTIPAIGPIFARFLEKYEDLPEAKKWEADEWKFILDKMLYRFVFQDLEKEKKRSKLRNPKEIDKSILATCSKSASHRFFGIFNSFSEDEFQLQHQCSLVHAVFFNYHGDFFFNILLVINNTYTNLNLILTCLSIDSWLNVRGDYKGRFEDAVLSLFDGRDLKNRVMTPIDRTLGTTKKIDVADSSPPISMLEG